MATLPPAALCEHRVPKESCVRCQPELAPRFQQIGDWCPEHDVPESQCHPCHPGLTFTAVPPLPEDADLLHLSRMGEDVEALEAHLAPGKVTLFDFYAHWCVPCRDVDAWMHELLARDDRVAVRKLNVMSWESPLAKRHLRSVDSLPYVLVYAADGRRVRAIAGLDLEALEAAVEEARR